MKHTAFLALSLAFAAPVCAQQTIPAPPGWTMQPRGAGAHVFTPPDLQTGEVYSVTLYDSAAMNGATLEEWARKFAGPVGKKPGQLQAAITPSAKDGRFVTAVGIYGGPNGSQLGALFTGVTLDGGANINAARVLYSDKAVFDRYNATYQSLILAMTKRAIGETGDNIVQVPGAVAAKLKPGGELVPGVYAGNQYDGAQLRQRFRVYIYANGEYRLCDQNDEDITKRYFNEQVGNVKYNRVSGQLDIDWTQGLGTYSDDNWCYYGRDANGKPAIYAEANSGFSQQHVLLNWVAEPTKRVSKSGEEAAKAAAQAEKDRFKYVTLPGKGVQDAQIAAIRLDSKYNGQSADETVYLQLKDGSVYADLPVPPDELDVVKSKQREPDKWGKWQVVGGATKVSWNGGKLQNLPGDKVWPSPAQMKLQGRWGTGTSSNNIITSSYALWGVTFAKNGRFKKDRRGGASSSLGFGENATNTYSQYDDEGSFTSANTPGVIVSSSQKKNNPNGAREGDYSLNGWVLTLRYDNGKVARLPFFFGDAAHKSLWFEGTSMTLDEKK